MALHLGPFELDRPITRGATAIVWRGRHRGTATPVAVKVMLPPERGVERFRARFAHEVRSVARLDHPGVVRLHDHGEVPPAVAAAVERGLRGALPAGAPYLVMEWVAGGTLARARACTPWTALRATILSLLDTLAHAHARGIVHRDLKPANVLLADRGPVLSDFGVAFAADTAPTTGRRTAMAGTPNYMAPEQVRGDWRSMGPHTDLYALGCLVYALVAGRAPFGGRPVTEILRAHQTEAWPPLRPMVPVPAGLDDWLARLSGRRVSDRFEVAADAALALLALPEETTVPAVPDAPPVAESDVTVVAAPVFVPVGEQGWRLRGPAGRAPLPSHWAEPDRPPPPPPLPGVGRSLFALRVSPLVGREAARDRLWAALGAVVDGQGPRVVLLEGASGHGKSRLTEWMAERVHALGAAVPIRVQHGPAPGPEWGLAAAIRRLFRCDGLDMPGMARRVERGLAAAGAAPDPELVRSIGAVMQPDARFELDGEVIELGSPRERHAAIAAALVRVAEQRPRLLIVDDAQWGADALGLVRRIVDRPGLPVLVLVAVRDDALTPGSDEARALAELAARPGVERLTVGPLSAETQARLLRSRLPLAPAVVDALVERTGGSPLFGEELVRHWIQTDALEAGPDGFRPRAGADETLPDGLASVWLVRVARAAADLGDVATSGLELAAILGPTVDPDEWRAACLTAGLPGPTALTERLLDHRLFHREDERLVFAHAMLRETLVQRARTEGRWAAHNAVCADVLAARGEPDPERRARFLSAAGRRAEALPLMILAADRLLARSEYLRVRRVLMQAVQGLRAEGQTRDGPGWQAVRVRWSRMARIQGRPDAALRHARRARATPLIPLRVRARLAEGLAHLSRGRLEAAWTQLEAAVAETTAPGVDPGLRSLALCRAGNCLIWLGRRAEARVQLDASLAVGDDPWPHADALLSLAELSRRERRLSVAARYGLRALALYRQTGSRWGIAQARLILGDVDRALDMVPAARAGYAEARRLCLAIGSTEGVVYADLREGVALVGLDRFAEAALIFDRLEPGADPRSAALIRAYRLPGHAARGDWAAFDACWSGLGPVATGEVAEPDVVDMARRCARLCADAGQGVRASDAADLAHRQGVALGWTDAAE